MNSFQQKIQQIQAKIPEIIKRLPDIAKIEGLKFIKDNFKNQGFEEKTGAYIKWQKKKKGKKPTLIGEKRGGAMRRSWEGESKASKTQVVFQSSLPYTEVHNEGLPAGKAPGFSMPPRPMIGPSEALNKRIEDKFDRMVEGVFK